MNPFALHLKLAHVKQLYFDLKKKKVSFPQGRRRMLDVFLEIPWRSEGLRVPFGRETAVRKWGAQASPGLLLPRVRSSSINKLLPDNLPDSRLEKVFTKCFFLGIFKITYLTLGAIQSQSSQIHPSVSPAVNSQKLSHQLSTINRSGGLFC